MAIVCDELLGSAADSYPYTKYMFDDGFPVFTWDDSRGECFAYDLFCGPR